MPDTAGFDDWVTRVVAPAWGVLDGRLAWLRDVYEEFGPVEVDRLGEMAETATREAAHTAAVQLAADLARTVQPVPRLEVTTTDGMVFLRCDGEVSPHGHSGIFGLAADDVLLECADYVQDVLACDWFISWPECAEHGAILEPDQSATGGVWSCSKHGHVVARIGELGL